MKSQESKSEKQQKGRPKKQHLQNVDINSWTNYNCLNNLIEFLLQDGRIRLFQLCGVGHKKILIELSSLYIEDLKRAQDQVDEVSAQQKTKEMVESFSKKYYDMYKYVFELLNIDLKHIFYLEKRVSKISFDSEGKLKIDAVHIAGKFDSNILKYQSQIEKLNPEYKIRLESENINELIHQAQHNNRQFYILLQKIRYQKFLKLLCFQLSDKILALLQHIAYRQIEDDQYNPDKLCFEIKENKEIRALFLEFINCQSIRNYLKNPLKIQEYLLGERISDLRYDNLKKQINNLYVDIVKVETLRQNTMNTLQFKDKISRLFNIVYQITFSQWLNPE